MTPPGAPFVLQKDGLVGDRNWFSGEFEHAIDSKGRLTIPVQYREALAQGMHVTRGLDGCLFVFTPGTLEILHQTMDKLSLGRESARFLERMIFSGIECALDKQGRILLPAPLREHAGIENEVVVVGVNSRLEIWSKERWRAVTSRLETDATAFAEGLAELGLL